MRGTSTTGRGWRYALAWVLATGLAVTVGVVAVNTLGESLRGRGPQGSETAVDADLVPSTFVAEPQESRTARTLTYEFGSFTVSCQGPVAFGDDVDPDTARGWRVVSYEPGPDDDVDAVFSNGRDSIDLEVYCNQGVPTVAEIERHTLREDED